MYYFTAISLKIHQQAIFSMFYTSVYLCIIKRKTISCICFTYYFCPYSPYLCYHSDSNIWVPSGCFNKKVPSLLVISPFIILAIYLMFALGGSGQLSQEMFNVYVDLRNMGHYKPWYFSYFWINLAISIGCFFICFFNTSGITRQILVSLFCISIISICFQYFVTILGFQELINIHVGRAHLFLQCFFIIFILQRIFQNWLGYLAFCVAVALKIASDRYISDPAIDIPTLFLMMFAVSKYKFESSRLLKICFSAFVCCLILISVYRISSKERETYYAMTKKIEEITAGEPTFFIVENDKLTYFFANNFLPNTDSLGLINRVDGNTNQYLKDIFHGGLLEIKKFKENLPTSDKEIPIYSFLKSRILGNNFNFLLAKKNYGARFIISDFLIEGKTILEKIEYSHSKDKLLYVYEL